MDKAATARRRSARKTDGYMIDFKRAATLIQKVVRGRSARAAVKKTRAAVKIIENARQRKSLKRHIQNRIAHKIPKNNKSRKNVTFGKSKVRDIEKQNNGYKVFAHKLGGKSLKLQEEDNEETDEETDTDDELYSSNPLRKL